MCWLLVDELLNFPCKVGHKFLPKSHIILVCKLYVADIFVELDIVEDEVEIFEFDAETCSRTLAEALWPLRRRIAAFFSAIEGNDLNHNDSLSNVTSLRPPRHDWKGVVHDSCPTCNDPVEGVVPDRLLDAFDPPIPILLCCCWQSANKII